MSSFIKGAGVKVGTALAIEVRYSGVAISSCAVAGGCGFAYSAAPTISSLTYAGGANTLTIAGTAFSATATDNVVALNTGALSPSLSCAVTSATATQLVRARLPFSPAAKKCEGVY